MMRNVTRERRRCATIALCAMTLLACGGSQSTVVEEKAADESTQTGTPLTPVLAKAHLADAAAEARRWKSDAFLIQVAGGRVADDGKIVAWQYGAYSPSAKNCLVIQFYRGNADTTESGGELCEADALPEFIDSDQAIRIARDNGLTHESVAMVASASPRNPRESVWAVIENGMRDTGDRTMDIDGATGKVLNTTRNP